MKALLAMVFDGRARRSRSPTTSATTASATAPTSSSCSLTRTGDKVHARLHRHRRRRPPGPINYYLNENLVRMFFGIYMITVADPQILWNDGFYPLVDVTIPDGSFWKPKLPGRAVNARNHGIGRVFDLFGGLLGADQPGAAQRGRLLVVAALHVLRALQRRATARASGSSSTRSASAASRAGRSATGRTGTRCGRASSTSRASTWSRTTRCASRSGRPSPTPAGRACTAAATASTSPTGSWSRATIAIHDDRWLTYPWGVNGGEPGARGRSGSSAPTAAVEVLPSKCTTCRSFAGRRAALRHLGWRRLGRPARARPGPRRAGGSPRPGDGDGARRYGVVCDADGVVDPPATDALRAEMRAGRPAELPVFDMGPPMEQILERARPRPACRRPSPRCRHYERAMSARAKSPAAATRPRRRRERSRGSTRAQRAVGTAIRPGGMSQRAAGTTGHVRRDEL